MIRCEGLTKFYGNHQAINDVSFHVKEGEIVGFLGPNAAGKTTTMRILTSFLPPNAGKASVAGHDVSDDSLESRRAIGYLPETCSLYDDMRVDQYLRFCATLRGMGRAETRDRLDYVLDTCSLDDRSRSIIGTLSRGYRQRVGLAQALLHDPPVLILDEPTIGLDPNQIIEVRELIRGLAGEHTILLSTHILPEAQMTCERVIIINHGEIIAEDTPEALTAEIRSVQTIALTVKNADDSLPRLLRDLPNVVAVREADAAPKQYYVDAAVGSDVRSVKSADLDSDVLTVKSADDNLPRLLRDVPNVLAVRGSDAEPRQYYVDSTVGSDVRAEVAEFVVNKGWGLLELRPVEMTLEDVFRQLTTEEEGVE